MRHTILCYGDSNTWGYVAGSRNYQTMYVERYDREHRWTGLLQTHLGEDFYVIEEGLKSRTTNLDDFPPKNLVPYPADRNGARFLPTCLDSHSPLDLVILALGGNDLKTQFNRSPEQIRDGLAELIEIIQTSKYGADMQSPPKILIVSQAIPLPISETFADEQGRKYLDGGIEKAKKLVPLFRELAQQKKAHFLDVTETVIPGEIDGMHFDAKAHEAMAKCVYGKVSEIFEKQLSSQLILKM